MWIQILTLSGVFFLLGSAAHGQAEKIDCLKCHQKDISIHQYEQSVHKDLTCTACHLRDETLPLRQNSKKKSKQISERKSEQKIKEECLVPFQKMDCSRCHAQEAKEYSTSVHNSERLPISCEKCHAGIHTLTSHKSDKLAMAKQCRECHSQQESYFQSSHQKGLEKGNLDSATCTDCHGLHSIAKVDNDAKGRLFHTSACLKCHEDKVMMGKSKLTTVSGVTYFNSFHGKNVQLGYPEKVAGCSDCHNSHLVLKSEEVASSIHPSNLVQTCQQCHGGATASFVKYIPHAEDQNKEKFPVLYWTRMAMTGLLVGTFLFFWVHSLLWAFRSFVEKYHKSKAVVLKEGGEISHYKVRDPQKIYRRFEKRHIYLHLLVVVSFLALAVTGLPLKFNSTPWGKSLMDFFGGVHRARLIHHTAALVTFTYFAIVIFHSINFLFYDKKIKGSLIEKLFGPDSLFPNWKDWSDLKTMFRWFFFQGTKPSFERWTYWEKFDFMAVFWGMFAIGSSGLLLWFPEFFGRFLPGWMFNLATIVHSDEALLATGFIFTVHFFNTHFRPEKFPMDSVIFNGEISKIEMLEERGDQWRRYESEGRTEEFVVTKPSSLLWDFVLKSFGFLAVLLGVSLVIGMIYAFF